MLGGIDPIIIFHRYKKTTVEITEVVNGISIVSKKDTYIRYVSSLLL